MHLFIVILHIYVHELPKKYLREKMLDPRNTHNNKTLDPRNTQEKKLWTHETPTRKNSDLQRQDGTRPTRLIMARDPRNLEKSC